MYKHKFFSKVETDHFASNLLSITSLLTTNLCKQTSDTSLRIYENTHCIKRR